MARMRLFCALLLVVGAIGAGVIALGTGTAYAASVTATFSKDSDWGSAYQARYTITNGTSTTISSWRVEFDLPAGSTLGSFWDATITTSGNHRVATNVGWNGTLTPAASTTFGFIVNGGGLPANCTINGGPCAGGSTTNPPPAPTNLRVASTTCTSVTVSWTASTGADTYDVSVGGTVAATVTGTVATVSVNPSTTVSIVVRARNAAGLSAPSGSVSATTPACPPGGSTLPVAPYVDLGAWPTPLLTDVANASGVGSYTLAFVTAVGGCRASWFNAFDPRTAWQKDQIDAIRARGGDVKVSFGGASGTELAQACTSTAALTAEYRAVVDAYALNYVDFDIEGAAVADRASVDRRSAALAQLQAAKPNLKISLTLPVLPEGLTADGVYIVRSAKNAGVNLNMVNVMAMDYYRGGDMGQHAISAANATFNQVKSVYPGKTDAQYWRMVGVTPMIGQNDSFNARGEVFTLADARELVTFAGSRHLGMLSFWEVTRDRNACTGALFKCTNVPQQPYDFSKIFNGFTG